jgi:hypothetical protein
MTPNSAPILDGDGMHISSEQIPTRPNQVQQLRQSHACYYITNIHKTRSTKDNQMNKRKMRKTMAVEAFYRE